ncbi:hypothetical protein J0A68_20870 [Algoriphagus sp. H41]|uniref:Uncharacterized protein n=1 Tax=Algoriphagus oliviformis TaxID=2811231 RepID=A0ABS3CBA4_9BACT|nr:hypothetical protein [Algoriphagus oliviformis]MBN7813421.1 hypothetical protein [Algoriphagus oliviformis]
MGEIEAYIEQYLASKTKNPDTWILHCSRQSDLTKAVYYAALAENHLGKRHPHQYRRSKRTLEDFSQSIILQADSLEKAVSFDEIYRLVEASKVYDVGPLTIYDTAQRIGAFVQVFPDRIYLHSGTKLGAEKILGRRLKRATMDRAELPKAFQDPRLTCADLEDILCHLKENFFLERTRISVKNSGRKGC